MHFDSAKAVTMRAAQEHLQCRVCNFTAKQVVHVAREMMYGTRQPFDYFQCGRCGCLQIGTIPKNIGDFYRSDYYSLKQNHAAFYKNRTKNFLNRLRDWATLFIAGGEHLPFMVKVPHIAASYRALRRVPGLSLSTRILDVGCGSGQLLYRLRNAGFRHLTGIDPFLAEDRHVDAGLSILKRSLATVEGEFDLILLNHSFEHVDDPLQTSREITKKLSDGGTALIRIPVADSAAWEEYNIDWFQLDAPRHLYLHTRASMKLVAQQANLQLFDLLYDSGPEQFVVSERYRRGLPMIPDPENSGLESEVFEVTPAQQRSYRKRAEQLNLGQRGDQASFYFRKA